MMVLKVLHCCILTLVTIVSSEELLTIATSSIEEVTVSSIDATASVIEVTNANDTSANSTILRKERMDHLQFPLSVFFTQFENEDFTGRGKKKGGLQEAYTMFMMCKSMISSLFMFVSPIIQVKSFGLSVINTLVGIGRFLIQLRNSGMMGGGGHHSSYMHHHGGSDSFGADRIGNIGLMRPYAPNYIHRHYTVPSLS